MESNIENMLKVGDGDRDKVYKVLNRLRHILKDSQVSEERTSSGDIDTYTNDKECKNNGLCGDTDNDNFKSITENCSPIIDNENKPIHTLDANISEFYNEHGIGNNTKLKDMAESHKTLVDESICEDTESNIIQQTRNSNEDVESKKDTETDRNLVNFNGLEDNGRCNPCVDSNIEDNNNTPCQVSSNIDDLNVGINELLLIVQEYEELKEKYLKLETSVESKMKCKCNEQSENHTTDISLEKISILQEENKRLTGEMELLNQRNDDNAKLQEALKSTIERLERDVSEQRKEATMATEKLSAHDVAAKRAITVLQKEMGARVEQVTKMYEGSVSEKDVYIIKIAKLETTIQELRQNQSSHQKKISEQDNELERVKGLLKVKETEHIKILSLNEQFEKDIAKLNKRVESHKEEMEGQEIKVKWSQNKLKTELEAHKETKKQLATLTHKLQEAKEEGEQIRRDCQEMIGRYQGDEEINSVSLRKQLEEEANKKKELESLYTRQNKDYKEQTHQMKLLKENNQLLTQQLEDQKAVVIAVEEKNTTLTKQLVEKEKDCAEMKTVIDDLKTQIKELQEVETKANGYEIEIKDLRVQVDGLTNQLNECINDVNEHKEKQREILLYSQSLTENNILSKTNLSELQSKLDDALNENKQLCAQFKTSEQDLLNKIESLTNDKKALQGSMDDLITQLEMKALMVNEISSELEETKNELKVMKKKNASQLKDLQRELHQTTRKIEQMESHSNGNGSIETLSNRSRTSSCNSLEKLHAADSPTYSASPNSSSSPQLQPKGVVIPQDHYVTQPHRATARNNNGCQELEIDKKMLVERICKLQKIHAKKNEKIEFLEDHNIQLTDALQKKSRIIQHYFSRQEPGIIAPDSFDNNRANISQHGGIMSSVYSARPNDKGMTLELSLAINHKLQAVLEDTVLKNITLQDSINTLGIEIAKLQAENKSKT